MASALTWLDYSERDRRRAMDVIDLFRETGTVDELGLAGVRDSFSDLFFPGTSTVQTRACYFLLVPWMFLQIERLAVPSSEAVNRARREELNLNRQLRAGTDMRGVLGAQAGDALKRLPSEIYWGGLGTWGIRAFSGHMGDIFDRLMASTGAAPSSGTRARPGGQEPAPGELAPSPTAPPCGFPHKNVSVALRAQDAQYLQERIQNRHPESMLAVLAGRADVRDLTPDWPWDLAHLAENLPVLRDRLLDAKLFAVCMQGRSSSTTSCSPN